MAATSQELAPSANALPAADAATPARLLELAVQSDADPDKLRQLMDLQERWEAQQSKRAFFAAMQAVQAEAPRIVRDAENTQTRSMYARLESINKRLTPVYTRHGFSLSFGTADSPLDGYVRTVCDVMHSGGHERRYHVDLPPDIAGIKGQNNKTLVHAAGSTLSYARRYLTLLIFNVALAGEDDDGNGAGGSVGDHITDQQVADLEALVTEVGADPAKFLAWLKVDDLASLPSTHYRRAVAALEAKRKHA